MKSNKLAKITIIVPCYNEDAVLPGTIEKLTSLLTMLIQQGKISSNSKICLIDDGSQDNSWEIISSSVKLNKSLSAIKLARNFGHQNALLAGLFSTDADITVTIDADLQDDISTIEKMIDKYYEGYEIVYGVRENRGTDTWFKRTTAQSFYKLMRLMGVEIIYNHADFRLLSRLAIEHLKQFNERNIFLRGVIPNIGYKTAIVKYNRHKRLAGESKYPLRKMLSFALNGITSFSTTPLRIITMLGFLIFFGSLLISGWIFSVKVFTDAAVPGWASTVLPIYFIGGIQILSIGVIGEYLGKIYLETKNRPRYNIEEIID